MTYSLPTNLYTCDQARALDQSASEVAGIPGIRLMKNAGRSSLEYALTLWPDTRSWVVLCGGGNNGGDGYVFAALAAQKHHRVQVFWLAEPDSLPADAARAYQYARQEGVSGQRFTTSEAQSALESNAGTVIVDALLGTGCKGEVREPYSSAINWINSSTAHVLSLDLPSGLNGDTGAAVGVSVCASATLTFVGCKPGLLTGQGPELAGQLGFADLGMPAKVYDEFLPAARTPNREELLACLPQRSVNAHKGLFGYLLVVGGAPGFGGAALMATETAAVTGVGLLGLATDPIHVTASLVRRPEVMVAGICSGHDVEHLLQKPTAIAIGPGLGTTPWSEQLLERVLQRDVPRVFDADALNILAEGRLALPTTDANWVLTPHPGEAARLLDCSISAIEEDRIAAVKKLYERFGGVIVLKGSGTLIYDGTTLVVAKVGNAGLARGGTGDILTGLIGGLLAQHLPPFVAAQLAVCIHGDAADLAVEETGMRGMLATDLILFIRELLA